MAPREECSPVYQKKRKREKRQTAVRLESAIRVTNQLIRQFSEMVLTDTDSCCKPAKRRKLSDIPRDGGSSGVDFVTDHSVKVPSSEPNGHQEGISSPDVTLMELQLCETDPLRNFLGKNINCIKAKILRINRIKNNCIYKAPGQEATFETVLGLFQNSVIFLQPRGRSQVKGIDSVVSRFSDFGKVLNIRNHWVQAKGYPKEHHPTVWAGATVSYSTHEGLDRACKAVPLREKPMVAVALVDHLTRIRSMELLWRSKFNISGTRGTAVVVEGPIRRMLRPKLITHFEKYGTVLDVKWMGKTDPAYSCEVLYKTTWSAVAAALAMDGKSQLLRCSLKTRLKITNKELYIHRQLCEAF